MRWSLLCLFLVLLTIITFDGILARPIHVDGNLELRAITRSAARKKAVVSPSPAAPTTARKTGSNTRKTGSNTRKTGSNTRKTRPTARKTGSKTRKTKPKTRTTKSRSGKSASKKPRPRKSIPKKSGIRTAHLKTSSKTYRKAAHENPVMFELHNGRLIKSKTPKTIPKGKDADHILEIQTVVHALGKAGITDPKQLGKSFGKIRAALNSPKNLVFVDSKINRAKGSATASAMAGVQVKLAPETESYMKQTKSATNAMVNSVQRTLKKDGFSVNLKGLQEQVWDGVDIRRRALFGILYGLEA